MKKNVKRDKIQADIYDEINIIVDYTGLTDGEILDKSSKLDAVMTDEYIKRITPLTYEEIEEYAIRQKVELSLAAKRNAIVEDNSIRYTRKDNLVEVVIFRNFTKIALDFNGNKRHMLRDYFAMMASLMVCLNTEKEFFKIQAIYLLKKNTIFCKSLYQVYRCFDKNVFGSFIQGTSNDLYTLNAIQNKETFFREALEFDVYKSVESGMDNSSRKEIYMGQLNITGKYNAALLDDSDVKDVLYKINEEIFDVFRQYLTDGFLEDMEEGKTTKLIGGFRIYDQCKE